MPGPLLAVDAPSLMYRAFHALPKSITGPDGTSVNALLGVSNLVLQAVEKHEPRAVVLCFGEEAAPYRVELFEGYHADRPEMPEELVPQWDDAPAYFGAFKWTVLHAPELEADDLLGTLAKLETDAGGTALLFTGDRDMFQCVSDDVAVLWPVGGKGEPEVIGPAGVRERYGISPDQVPDFIALRGDPSDGIPGAKGIGEKTARELLRDHPTLEDLITAAASPRTDLRPRVRASLTDDADALRDYRKMATLQPVDIERPPDQPTDWAAAAAAARERGMNRLAERLEAFGSA
jgi:5'-3' exonuclease